MMQSTIRHRWALIALGVPLLLLTGCFEYEIKTTFHPDDTGVRTIELTVVEDEDDPLEVSIEEFRKLLGVADDQGFTEQMGKGGEKGQEDVRAFRKDVKVKNLESWTDLSGDVHISGAFGKVIVEIDPGDTGESTDWVLPAPVSFQSSIEVEEGWYIDRPTRTYRETFAWENLVDVLIEHQWKHHEPAVELRFPDLTPTNKGELRGMLKEGLRGAIEQGILDMEEAVRAKAFQPLIDRLTEQSMKIVQERWGPPVSGEHAEAERFLHDMIHKMVVERDEMDEVLLEGMPGVTLAYNTTFRFQLTMPGKILETNAKEQDGSTLTWEFSPIEALGRPIEIFAESWVE